eukprot:Skav201836  [mRNA]  locus=scaffold484:100643:106808:- [translate_table: standard]
MTGECYRCGKPGHRAKGCRVRLVDETSGAEGSTQQQNKSEQQPGPHTSYVKRVEFSPFIELASSSTSHDAFFDVSDLDPHDGSVCMVSDGFISTSVSTCASSSLPCVECSAASIDLAGNVTTGEYSLRYSDGVGMFTLALPACVDDMEHYVHTVSLKYALSLYDIEVGHGHVCKRRFLDSQSFKLSQHDVMQCSADVRNHLDVRAISFPADGHDIIVDSGSDATVLPLSLIEAGKRSAVSQDSSLRDAQGRAIDVVECRDICFDLETDSGQIVTIKDKAHFSSAVMTPEEFGFAVRDVPGRNSSDASSSTRPAPREKAGQPASSERPTAVPVTDAPTDQQMTQNKSHDGVVANPGLTSVPTTINVEAGVEKSGLTIAGVTVFPDSSIALFRASCKHLEISQSGGKLKLWNRIVAHLDKQKLLAETELAHAALKDASRDPVPVQTAQRPTDESEIQLHMLTHTPYQPWCEACVQAKGRPERHEQQHDRRAPPPAAAAVGTDEFSRIQAKELIKSQMKTVSRVLFENGSTDGSRNKQSFAVTQLAKQVLRILSACSLVGQTEASDAAVRVIAAFRSSFSMTQVSIAVILQVAVSQLTQMKMILWVILLFTLVVGATGGSVDEPEALSLELGPIISMRELAMLVLLGAGLSVLATMARGQADNVVIDLEAPDDGDHELRYNEQSVYGVLAKLFGRAKHIRSFASEADKPALELCVHALHSTLDMFENEGMDYNAVESMLEVYRRLRVSDPSFIAFADADHLELEDGIEPVTVEDCIYNEIPEEYQQMMMPEVDTMFSPESMMLVRIESFSHLIRSLVEECDIVNLRRFIERRAAVRVIYACCVDGLVTRQQALHSFHKSLENDTPPSSDGAMSAGTPRDVQSPAVRLADTTDAAGDAYAPRDPFLGYSVQQMEEFTRAEDRFLGIYVDSDEDALE